MKSGTIPSSESSCSKFSGEDKDLVSKKSESRKEEREKKIDYARKKIQLRITYNGTE